MKPQKFISLLLSVCMLFSIVMVGSASTNPRISIVTAASGGAWYSIGGALADLFKNEIPGAVTDTGPGGGISNIFTVSVNEAQLGFGFPNDVIDAENGVGDFAGNAIQNIRGVTAIYPGILHIATAEQSNINSIEDLKGKVLCTQQKGNSAEKAISIVLQAYGMSYDDMKAVNFVGFTDAVDLIKDGHADAIAYMSTYPYAALKDLAESRGVKLLGIDEEHYQILQSINPAYDQIIIPGGAYKGTDEDISCIGAKTILFTNAEMPEDLVYAMTKTMYDNTEYLHTVNSSLAHMTPEYGSDTGIKLHPGAEKYFMEIGVIK